MKSNIEPTFSKSIEFNSSEIIMIITMVNFVLSQVKTLKQSEIDTLDSIIDKLDAPEHLQNN